LNNVILGYGGYRPGYGGGYGGIGGKFNLKICYFYDFKTFYIFTGYGGGYGGYGGIYKK
jgi:hypothetical protein